MASKVQKLGGGARFQPADFSIHRFAAMVPAGTTMADVLHPEFFANHLDKMRSGMEVTVLSEDYELDALLRVMTVTRSTAKVRVLAVYAGEKAEQRPADEVTSEDIKVSHGGPHHKWRFVHGDYIEHGFASREDAEAASVAYLEKIKE